MYIKPSAHKQVFLDKTFPLTSLLVEKLACQLFNEETCHVSSYKQANKTCQIETCQGKLARVLLRLLGITQTLLTTSHVHDCLPLSFF